jgi:hypothetical protein
VKERVRDGLRRAVRTGRAYLAPPGDLPAFVIIGAQRCGTTSLHRWLSAHPSVTPATGKELQYLTLHHARGERWYRGHFPRGATSFEATPYYLFHPQAALRAAAALPHTRFVALLREPVERAWSHYLHSRAYGLEPLGFADALAAEDDRLAHATRHGTDTREAHRALRAWSYAARGRYAEQLTRWYAHIPRERIHVLRTEDLDTEYADLLAFLGLSPHTPSYARHTRRRRPEPPPPEAARTLHKAFHQKNEDLATLLDRPAPLWP